MNVIARRFALLAAMLVTSVAAAAQTSPLRLTPEQAVALALEHDLELKRDRIGPQIAEIDVRAARTAWTPDLSASVLSARRDSPQMEREWSSEVAFSQRLPWGSSYRLSWEATRHDGNAGATFVQPLLRGLTIDAARAERGIRLRTRELADTDLAAAFASTKRDVLYAYWSWAYAHDYRAVQRQSLAMAQALLDGNRSRVATGAMAAVDVIEAEAEVARRAEAILIAEKNVANAEERLRLHILDPDEQHTDVELLPEPGLHQRSVPSEVTSRALAQRQDLKSIQTSMAIDAIHIRRFRNDSLPDVALLMDYSRRGVGGIHPADARDPSWSFALAVSYPLGTARAEAQAALASAQRQQRAAALRAAEQRVVLEVNAAVREVETNARRLETSAKAVALAERRLDAEQRKFASGLSTSFFVFQAQRDLSQAREAQLQAVLDHRLATVNVEAVQIIPIHGR